MKNDPFQEMLDDPSIPFDVRWKIIKEIDKSNSYFFIFFTFMKHWNFYLNKIFKNKIETFQMLEIGPGSGALGLKILNWAGKNNIKIKYHLFDSQQEVLNECMKEFKRYPTTESLTASQSYLRDFQDNSFDVTLSLNVLHHIQPRNVAIDAIEQMLRVSKNAIYIMDFQQTRRFLFRFKILHLLFGFTKNLSDDGLKSMQRAYKIEDLKPILLTLCEKYGFQLHIKKMIILPYWIICAIKK